MARFFPTLPHWNMFSIDVTILTTEVGTCAYKIFSYQERLRYFHYNKQATCNR